GESWWPAMYGAPARCGDSEGIRYAFFPRQRRLLVQVGSRIDAYDTGAKQVTGCAHQTGDGAGALVCSTPQGELRLSDLSRVDV
ncbi:MAG: SHOCT domain-containing protein, partial [Tepidisphaeraceae bacterium]